jgi:hypothetical protein
LRHYGIGLLIPCERKSVQPMAGDHGSKSNASMFAAGKFVTQ